MHNERAKLTKGYQVPEELDPDRMWSQTRRAIVEAKRINTKDHTWKLLTEPRTEKQKREMWNTRSSEMAYVIHY